MSETKLYEMALKRTQHGYDKHLDSEYRMTKSKVDVAPKPKNKQMKYCG